MDFDTMKRWWSGVGKGREGTRDHGPDHGNMGTAVALDASLEALPPEPMSLDTQPSIWALSWEERAARQGL